MLGILRALFGSNSDKLIKSMKPLLDAIRDFEPICCAMTDGALRAQTAKFKEQLSQGASLDDILPEAFATVRETAKRVLGMRHFDVQIIGGIVLHRGSISEMVTGEGKTLVATLPCYLNALPGKGLHVVTVNDYLARRDCEWMSPVYEFLGLTVGLIQHDMDHHERQVGYRADITYGTNNEYGFDYLRDNMARHPDFRVQRPLNYAIIDEIDSILIDEARTPLIISGRPQKSTELYVKVDEAVRRLRKGEDFELEEKGRHVLTTEDGMGHVEKLLGMENLFVDDPEGIVHMVEQSIRAHYFYKCDDEYVVRDGQILLVDEFTGRMMEGRRLSDGLHQAIEAKERVPVQFEFQTIASISYQNYFMLYNKICGMTGTALTEAQEFATIYNLDVIEVPTNLPMQRHDFVDFVFATEAGKYRWVIKEIVDLHETGRPVLVGTTSIEKSELVARMLRETGVDDFQVLNAKYHEREATIVSNAGKRGAITIATNMAGRGTDIKLGEGVRETGGLAIVGTERHESRRIDNQLRGRCGRQGDPGTTQFFLSLEDEVARLFGGDKVKRLIGMFGGEQQMDDEPLEQRMVSRSIERAQRQVEEHNFEIRKHLKDYDDVMNKQRQIVYLMRREVLEDRDVTDRLQAMMENLVQDAIDEYTPEDALPDDWDMDGLATRMRQVFGFEVRTEAQGEEPLPLFDDLLQQVQAEYKKREAEYALDLEEDYKEFVGGDPSRINFPRLARKHIHDWEKMALLRAVDERWIDHLYSMDYLREAVRLRAVGQRDPLVEYKAEGYEIFSAMMQSIEEEVIQTLFRITHAEVRKARRQMARDGVQREVLDPLANLSQYRYVSSDKQQDRSFAAFDTSKYDLAGQDKARAARQRAAASSPVQPDNGNAAPEAPAGNRAQRRRQERDAKRKRGKGK